MSPSRVRYRDHYPREHVDVYIMWCLISHFPAHSVCSVSIGAYQCFHMPVNRIVYTYMRASPAFSFLISLQWYRYANQESCNVFKCLTLVSNCEEITSVIVIVCNERRIYSREIMPISVKKCSYIMRRAKTMVNRGAIHLNLLLGIGSTIFGDPPSNKAHKPKMNPTYLLQNIIPISLHSFISLKKLMVPMYGSNNTGKDKRDRDKEDTSMVSFWLLSGDMYALIDCLVHI